MRRMWCNQVGGNPMSGITLQEQIEFLESHIPMWEANRGIVETDKAIFASLKRLQAIEGQEAVAWKFKRGADNWAGIKIPSWVAPETAISPLYELPPDAQGMIDKLKAERDALMLEYCPDEMSEEQIKEWAANQVVSGLNVSERDLPPLPKPAALINQDDDNFWGELQDASFDLKNGLSLNDPLFSSEQMHAYARAALNQPAIPEGFAIVPIKLTREMRQAFNVAFEETDNGVGYRPDREWKAMLAAAKGGE